MNLQRVVRGIGLLGVFTVAACSSSSSGPTSPVSPATSSVGALVDEYEPVGDVPLSGGITEISFPGASTYSLRRLQGASAAELLSVETGTYTLSADGSSITLTPAGQAPKTFSFQIVSSSPAASVQSHGLHINGLGDILKDIFSFVFNGQTFQSDGTVPDPSDSTELDAGASSDASEADAGGGSDDEGDDAGSSSETSSASASSGSGTGTSSSQASSSQASSSQESSGGSSGTSSSSGGAMDAGVCMDVPAPTSPGNGVDVSHYQGNVNWPTVHSAKTFAYAKATEGTSYTDTKFSTYFSGMKSAGISRGAYHFFRASKSGKAQADYFASVLLSHGYNAATDLPPMLDLEVTDGVSASTVITQARAFLTEAQAKLGVTLVLYTGPSFFISTLGNPNFSGNPLWIAQYTSASKPRVPSHWSNYTIWQFSESLPVTGIGSAGVDNDRWQGSTSGADAGAQVKKCSSDAGVKDAGNDTSTKDAGSKDATALDAGPDVVISGGDAAAFDGSVHDAFTSDATPTDAWVPPPDAALIPGTCTHDVCTAGEALGQACNQCTYTICNVDPYCCDTLWGPSCFPDVEMYCGMTCN